MRTVWAQATRPRLSCAPAPRSSLKSIAARRSAAANASRNQIAACDVFALFLAPVLAVAAFADVSWKDKKRKEWEQRFAEINQQLELLRAREVEIWTRIQYRSVRHGILQQKRMYSTAAAPVAQVQPSIGEDADTDSTPAEENMTSPLDFSALSYYHGDRTRPSRSLVELAADAPLIHYEKLLALQLALRIILHNHTGSDDMYADAHHSNAAPHVAAEDIGRVVFRLRAVTDELEAIDRRREFAQRKVPFRHDSRDDLENWYLRRTEIVELGQLFRNKQIDLAGLVDRVSQWLLNLGSKPPGPMMYAELVMLFSRNNLPDLAHYAISALQNTTYALSESEICVMLDHSSMTKNLKAYDWVIHNLTDPSGVLATESTRWEWKRTFGVLLPLPVDRSPRLLRALIRTDLIFDNSRRAEAYAKLDSTTYSRNTMGYVIKAFLQYYTRKKDWKRAFRWLRKAQWWCVTSSTYLSSARGSVLCRVFDTLIAMDKRAQYEKLLQAVVATGIEPPTLDGRGRDGTRRMQRIVGQWQKLINANNPKRSPVETVPQFKECLRIVMAEVRQDVLPSEETLTAQSTPPANSAEARTGRLEDAVQRSELALSKLDDYLLESRQLHAELAKQSTQSHLQQQSVVSQSDIIMLKDIITRDRENHKRVQLEQQRAMKEQEATIAALRAELQSLLAAGNATVAGTQGAAETTDAVDGISDQENDSGYDSDSSRSPSPDSDPDLRAQQHGRRLGPAVRTEAPALPFRFVESVDAASSKGYRRPLDTAPRTREEKAADPLFSRLVDLRGGTTIGRG